MAAVAPSMRQPAAWPVSSPCALASLRRVSAASPPARKSPRVLWSRQPVEGAKLLLCLSQPLGQVARAGVGPASFGRPLAAGRQQSNPKGGLQIEFAPVALGSLRKSPQGVQAGRELRDGLLHS